MVLLANMELNLSWVLGLVDIWRNHGVSVEKWGIDLEGVVPELVVYVCEIRLLEVFHSGI